MLTTINLHGRLGKLFGRVWKLDVSSPNEALRAMCTLKPEFRLFLMQSEKLGVVYRFCANMKDLEIPELCLKMPGKVYDLFPIPQGSKNANVFKIIVGVVLIAVSYGMLTHMGLSFAALGSAGTGLATASFYLGASMIIGGIAGLILNPKMGGLNSASSEEGQRSYLFSGSAQTTRQGGPVPVGYGKLYIGAQVISAGLNTGADGLGLAGNGAVVPSDGSSPPPVDSETGEVGYGTGPADYYNRGDGNTNWLGGISDSGNAIVPARRDSVNFEELI